MTAPASPARAATLELLDALFGSLAFHDFRVRLWDGSEWRPPLASENQPGRFVLVLKHPSALRRMFWNPSDLTLGEAFIFEDFDVEGDIVAIFELADELFERHFGLLRSIQLHRLIKALPASGSARPRVAPRPFGWKNSQYRDRQSVRYHYDVSNDFYRLWLDRRMVYSCAYFPTGREDLDTAQEKKLDYLCRKLRLRPGESLLDMGCGWGALIMYAARHYGVNALGITLSGKQAELAERRIHDAGLAGRCRVEVRDYRELAGEERFDKIVSVGMVEHVGAGKLPLYFRRAWDLLRRGGTFLNHGIAESVHKPDRHASFIAKYVFPDGELVPISHMLREAERVGWEVRDVESLREHYALTLQHWLKRLEEQAEAARRAGGNITYRIWRLYIAGASHRFRTGWLNLYQSLLAKPHVGGRSGLPMSRADWFR